MTLLARGLKKQFGVYASSCVSALLEKFKEKKHSVVLSLRDAVDAIYLSVIIYLYITFNTNLTIHTNFRSHLNQFKKIF